jgi:amidase
MRRAGRKGFARRTVFWRDRVKRLTREHLVPANLRGRVYEPAMTVEPGETILVETINHMTPIVRTDADLHPHRSPEYRERQETGPIAVAGAQPGDMLAVRIDKIDVVGLPHAHGWGPLSETFPQQPMSFPVEDGKCKLPGGLELPLTPMIGEIYTTPATLGARYYDLGGNMDFTEIRPGNTLYLPVELEGGLLVLGDVHAVQGDGELYGEAAETAADVTITLDVDRTYRSKRPIVETADRLICIAGRGTPFDGLQLAVQDMTDLIARVFGLGEADAYVYATLGGSIQMAGSLSRRQMAEGDALVALSVPLAPLRKAASR